MNKKFYGSIDELLKKLLNLNIHYKLDGDKIKLANQYTEDVLGIISAMPTVLGDTAALEWHGKYVKDKWGRIQYAIQDFIEEQQTVDEDGNQITEEVTINELLNMYLDPNLEIVLPSMILYGSSDIGDEKENITTSIPKTMVKVGTTSVIKDGKILGYLSEEESKTVNLINGNLTKTILKISYEDGYVVFEPNRIKTKQKLDIKDNKITIEISGFSKIKEFHTNKNIKNMKTVEKLNKYFNKEIENMIKDNFNQIREKYNTDMFGFQELYYRTDHKYFKKYCSNWYETTFPNIELEVKSNIKLYEKGNTLGGIKYERENN